MSGYPNDGDEHIELASKCIMDDLDFVTPYHVLGLLYCVQYTLSDQPNRKKNTIISYFTTCVKIGQLIGMEKVPPILWASPLGNPLGLPNTPVDQVFVKNIWYTVCKYDWYQFILFNNDFMIESQLVIPGNWRAPQPEPGPEKTRYESFHFLKTFL